MFKALRLWSSDFTTPFAEALKEAFRVTLFAIPSMAIVWLEDPAFSWKVAVAGVLLVFIRALDKYLYIKSRKEGARSDEAGGLSPI